MTMAYNYLDTLREDTAAEPARLAGLLDMALDEYRKCMAHDEELPLPDGMPENILGLLRHGAELALDRARVVGDAISANVNRLPLSRVPKHFREFHKDHKPVSKSELWAALNDDRDGR